MQRKKGNNMKRRRSQGLKYRKKSRSGYFISAVILLLLASVVLLPQFYIKEIEVNGLRVIDEQQLVEFSGLNKDDHIFKGINGSLSDIFSMRHKSREEEILSNFTYAKSVVVRSGFPGKVHIDIVERIEVAYIAITDGFVIIDSEGVAVEVLGKSSDFNIPAIEGVQVAFCETGKQVDVDMQDYLKQSIVLLNHVVNADYDSRSDVNLLEKIISIRPVNNRISFLEIRLQDENLIVKVRNSDKTFEDMIWLRFAIQQGVLEGKNGRILDLTTSQRAFRDE